MVTRGPTWGAWKPDSTSPGNSETSTSSEKVTRNVTNSRSGTGVDVMAADAPGTVSQVTAQALPRLRAPKRARLWQPQRLTRRRSLQAAMARRVLSCSPRSVFPKTPRGLQFCLVANYLITSGSCSKQCSSIRYRGTTDRLDYPCSLVTSLSVQSHIDSRRL